MQLPFTRQQFFDQLAAYNGTLWPAVVALWVASVVAVVWLASLTPRKNAAEPPTADQMIGMIAKVCPTTIFTADQRAVRDRRADQIALGAAGGSLYRPGDRLRLGRLEICRAHSHLAPCGRLIIADGSLGLFWPFAPMHLREALAAGGSTRSDTLHIVLASVTVLLMLLAIGVGAAAFGKRFRLGLE
jgi:hypothetical protein